MSDGAERALAVIEAVLDDAAISYQIDEGNIVFGDVLWTRTRAPVVGGIDPEMGSTERSPQRGNDVECRDSQR